MDDRFCLQQLGQYCAEDAYFGNHISIFSLSALVLETEYTSTQSGAEGRCGTTMPGNGNVHGFIFTNSLSFYLFVPPHKETLWPNKDRAQNCREHDYRLGYLPRKILVQYVARLVFASLGYCFHRVARTYA